jgi:sortase (surface protein transpeptidase)
VTTSVQRRRRPLELAASLLLLGCLLTGQPACGTDDSTAELRSSLPDALDDINALARQKLAPRGRAERARDDRPQPVDRHHGPQPTSIEIPAIGVSAPVVTLGLNPDGTLEVPTDFDETGWYEQGAEPGELGPAVITGHVDSETGPAVFYRLSELGVGDLIEVHREDGTTARFVVNRVKAWPKVSFPTRQVYGDAKSSVLRLVTCSGSFDESTGHYVDNTIVYARHR